jgi:hypothetical protein
LFPNAPLGNANTVGVGCQSFGSTLLIGASILLADAKIAVLSGVKTTRQALQSGIVASIFLPDAKIAVKVDPQITTLLIGASILLENASARVQV